MTDYVATRSGGRLRVKLTTGWTITYEDGDTHANISAPGYQRATGAIKVEPKRTNIESLVFALVEDIRYRDPSTDVCDEGLLPSGGPIGRAAELRIELLEIQKTRPGANIEELDKRIRELLPALPQKRREEL